MSGMVYEQPGGVTSFQGLTGSSMASVVLGKLDRMYLIKCT